MTKKITAISLSYNEADVISECVKDALQWCDHFVLYDNSTDDTADIAEAAGAEVIRGPLGEPFSEHMRQNCLNYINRHIPETDWVVRVDPDEFYPRGVWFKGLPDSYPRRYIEHATDNALRAHVVQFWITLDDVKRGLLLEDDSISVQKRRRWYSVGHTATVAWKHDPELFYPEKGMRNTPAHPDPRKALCPGAPMMIQTHYTCRSWPQLWNRVQHRKQFRKSFGKYVKNLIIDERHLHYWDGGALCPKVNHGQLYKWFDEAEELFKARGL